MKLITIIKLFLTNLKFLITMTTLNFDIEINEKLDNIISNKILRI